MLLNVDRAMAVLGRHGVDALVATSPENVTYASDFDTLTQYVQRAFQAAVILPAHRWQPVLLAPVGDYTYLHERPSWIEDVRLFGSHNVTTSADASLEADRLTPIDAAVDEVLRRSISLEAFVPRLAQAIRDLGVEHGRVAMDWLGMPPVRAEELRAELPGVEFVEGFALWREIRLCKTPDEIARIRRAIAANQAGFEAAFGRVAVGATEHEVLQAHRRAVTDAGGLPPFWDSGIGRRSYAFRPMADRPFEPGDVVRIDGCSIVERYWSDLGRTASLGSASEKVVASYAALREGTEAAIAHAGPGARPSELYRIAIERVRTRGIPHYRRSHVGHGIGLEFYETPHLTATGAADAFLPGVNDPPLEAGMVINVETPYYEIGFGGLQLEETILITPTGSECLSSLPRELRVIGSATAVAP